MSTKKLVITADILRAAMRELWNNSGDVYFVEPDDGQEVCVDGWFKPADLADAINGQLTAGVALPAATLREGNWPHPDNDGSRIVGWRIPAADVERMGADVFCLPREVGECLAKLQAARGVEPARTGLPLRMSLEPVSGSMRVDDAGPFVRWKDVAHLYGVAGVSRDADPQHNEGAE